MPITENIQTQLDKGKYCAGVFVDLKKAFDTVDHNMLLQKLDYYGIRGIANECSCSYLKKRKQFVSIENNMSSVKEILTGVPQGSILGPLRFLIYINDLHKSIRFSKRYHFADDTSIIQSNPSLKRLSKQVNKGLSNLLNWLRANELSLNVRKTELVIFRPRKLKIDHSFKFKLDGKRLVPTHSIKYLGVLIDEHLPWNKQIAQIKMRLNHAIGMLSKLRTNANFNILKTAYNLLFFFNCYLAAPWPTSGHYLGDSLTHPMLITAFLHIRPEGHREPHSEVGSLSLAEHLAGFEPGTFRF